jgi:phosphatidylglycerol lysyltransferase
MAKVNSSVTIKRFLRTKFFIFLNENGKVITQFIFTALFIGMAAWLIKHEKTELGNVKEILLGSNKYWVLSGLSLVVLYIMFQGMMYVTSFACIHSRLKLRDAIILFLKRNFISVFLPAGGVSSLAFFVNDIEKKGITRTQVYFASSIYAFVGILSVVIVAIPAFLFTIQGGGPGMGNWCSLPFIIPF